MNSSLKISSNNGNIKDILNVSSIILKMNKRSIIGKSLFCFFVRILLILFINIYFLIEYRINPNGIKYIIDNQLLKKLPEGDKGNKFIKINIDIIAFLLSIYLLLNELKK